MAAASHEHANAYNALRRANTDVVSVIKAVKHLRKNLLYYLQSDNPNIRREYNRFRIRIGEVLRSLAVLRDTDDSIVALLSLDRIRVDILGKESEAVEVADGLIRIGAISSQMATSLINEGAYVREVIQHLLDINEDLHRSELVFDDSVQDELALRADEIANIARHAGEVR